MDKKKRIITAIVMLAVYFLIHILFIKDSHENLLLLHQNLSSDKIEKSSVAFSPRL